MKEESNLGLKDNNLEKETDGNKKKIKDKRKKKVENFGLNDIIYCKENFKVLKKFFIFVLLIILSPVILIILYNYFFKIFFNISKNDSLLYSLYCTAAYILFLTLLYAYLAFKEDNNIKHNDIKTKEEKKVK
ncbi:conserved Plasmodium protein, unknown function [Plasmodium relictum]|uniref:Vacuolar ATPase assembly integral membrane protein VMA21 homolog n=1 Tax=Plasmodium relictum TaxID=85471 RepID=A0A1J1H9G4_PLARL|nr:conserved Plasmodium protein, unknown function [Plasmodium relictum]CRH01618.1 conserved Plasmodium protein, unknown function [Plasmodium relictum]